jgi:hypothetical protein
MLLYNPKQYFLKIKWLRQIKEREQMSVSASNHALGV